jgi:hypothetical protein
MYQQPALKGRNPAIDSMPPFQGYGRETAFIHRALPCATDDRAFSPSSARRRDAMHCVSTGNGTPYFYQKQKILINN